MEFKEVSPDEIPLINRIISDSKSFWKQGEEYLAKALPLLTIDQEWIDVNRGFAIYNEDLIGFLGIEIHEGQWFLEHLWISPARLGENIGTRAIELLKAQAETHRIERVLVFPEPPSEGFYLKMGARYTGRKVQSRIAGGPEFREMEFRFVVKSDDFIEANKSN